MVRDVTDRDFAHPMEQAGVPVLVEFWNQAVEVAGH